MHPVSFTSLLLSLFLCALLQSHALLANDKNHSSKLEDIETYIVTFKTPALASRSETFNDLLLSKKHLQTLKFQHQEFLTQIKNNFNREFKVIYNYTISLNGISLELTPTEFQFISKQPEVLSIVKQRYLHIATDATAHMIQADKLWTGEAITPAIGVKGEDVIVAVIDTGINFPHESFSDNPEDNYDFAAHNPFGSGHFIGWCDPNNSDYDPSYGCNNKIIGAWDFIDVFGNETDGPIDDFFHGSTISGIISGNYITAPPGGFVLSLGGGTLNAPFISGIAPHSHIIMYDVCDDVLGCPTSAIIAAIDQAILDGVDVINLSLDGGLSPWTPASISYALLNANNVGIITSTAAGNATSGAPSTFGRVNNLAPWVITTANSLHGRTQSNDISAIAPIPVPSFLLNIFSLIANGISIASNIQGQILYAKDIDNNNQDGCLAWNALDFDNAIALIQSGNCSNELKVQNAQDANAIAAIIINTNSETPITMTGINTPNIPAFMIGQNDADNLITAIQQNSLIETHIEIVAQTIHRIVNSLGLVLYHSSLAGPNTAFNITKPDIAAPGTNIFAAIAELGQPAPQYYATTGTSQSTAVVSGSLALLKNIHPNWSPSELKSILMLSTQNNIKHENGNSTTTDDVGSGMLNLSNAANSMLVLDESYDNYVNANPAMNGSPKTLNLASLRDENCNSTCYWTRTLTNKDSIAHTWNVSVETDSDSEVLVSPSNFNLLANQSIALDIDFNITGGTINQYRFARVILTENNHELPQSQLTIVVNVNDLVFSNGFE